MFAIAASSFLHVLLKTDTGKQLKLLELKIRKAESIAKKQKQGAPAGANLDSNKLYPETVMGKLPLRFKKLDDNAFSPEYSSDGAAGLDLRCTWSNAGNPMYVEYGTDISVEIPKGYVGLLFPRSSVSKTPHMLANSVGVIDSDYRGEIMFRYKNVVMEQDHVEYGYGEKVGQLVILPLPLVALEEVSDLDTTGRGDGGFGSTGR